jgi:colanic acid/amylovoran biosynthesis glycosyltransferase
MGCDPKKVRVHRSGIRLGKFRYAERRPTPGEPIRLVTIGRCVEKKGIAYGIRAVARLKASGRRVIYSVVGDGPLRRELERLAHELDAADVVQLLPPRSHQKTLAILDRAHLVVQPSVTGRDGDQEGIPNVLKEAMAMGVPVVSTLHSGIPELVEDGVSGFLVPERDVDALVDRLAHLIEHPERWPEMGRAGRRKIEAEYDSDRLNQQLLDLYRELLVKEAR